MILSVCGKGGVGKTTVCAMLASAVFRDGRQKTLVIDADPSGGLCTALGIRPSKTINDIRKELTGEIKKRRGDKVDLALSADFLAAEALDERGNLAFLAIGRPEEEGCYCRVNVLLKEAIETLAAHFDRVLIDAEAGVEQVNRKVLGSVDFILLVSDATKKGVSVALAILDVARKINGEVDSGIVFNRIKDPKIVKRLSEGLSIKISGFIPEDETVTRYDEEGLSFFEIPDCPSFKAVRMLAQGIGFLS